MKRSCYISSVFLAFFFQSKEDIYVILYICWSYLSMMPPCVHLAAIIFSATSATDSWHLDVIRRDVYDRQDRCVRRHPVVILTGPSPVSRYTMLAASGNRTPHTMHTDCNDGTAISIVHHITRPHLHFTDRLCIFDKPPMVPRGICNWWSECNWWSAF